MLTSLSGIECFGGQDEKGPLINVERIYGCLLPMMDKRKHIHVRLPFGCLGLKICLGGPLQCFLMLKDIFDGLL